MAVEKWMRADPLMSLLLDRGEGSEHAYECVEAVAWRVEGGMSEKDAIISVLGYCPHPIAALLESAATNHDPQANATET